MLREFWDEVGKVMAAIIGIVMGIIIVLSLIMGAFQAHYQSQVTGYSFWQCFWAGDTIRTINLRDEVRKEIYDPQGN